MNIIPPSLDPELMDDPKRALKALLVVLGLLVIAIVVLVILLVT